MSERAATERLTLTRPTDDDLAELHTISADPRVWRHFPSLRHTSLRTTSDMLARWRDGWDAVGLGVWVARRHDEREIVGYGGCSDLGSIAWNLGYRIAPDAHGFGYATEIAQAGIAAAGSVDASKPVIAYLLEHNVASACVAEKLGLTLRHRGPDAGNPDASAVRLVFADRELTEHELVAATA